ncbi:hypothetical protein DT73_17865 [Mangrovibacter sp. MFB070]|uniref:GGDEF domain-containing protein n=1 Tax=Mangrovibacter sp. MFB070 TaxID=1224318 RepID=UPI0004D980BC|nr:GGDEF domain-containing protein [Mangrovibacter sp. MFB070]KEA51242.1 hypothetical protein DT73_17865 [Mangrovibacter sp. MFB070]
MKTSNTINTDISKGSIWFSLLNVIFCVWLIIRGSYDLTDNYVYQRLTVLYITIITLSFSILAIFYLAHKKEHPALFYSFHTVIFLMGLLWAVIIYILLNYFNDTIISLNLSIITLLPATIAFYTMPIALILFSAPIFFILIFSEFFLRDFFTGLQLTGGVIILFVVTTAYYILAEWYERATKSERENQTLIKTLKKTSDYDSLTGLKNRRSMHSCFESIKNRIPADIFIYAFVIDIDFFKQYNDTLGHIAGDKCLVKVASCIKNAVRKDTDNVFRFGGEEFVILATGNADFDPYELADRIQSTLKLMALPHPSSAVSDYVTVSIGGAKGHDQLSFDSLIQQADIALYQAKEGGRNRAEIITNNKP